MLETRFQTSKYDVSIYTTSLSAVMSCSDCIELVSPVAIPFPKEFVLREGRVFCKVRAEGRYPRLKAVVVRRLSEGRGGFAVLRALVPSVFHVRLVRKINFQRYLYLNRFLIMRSSAGIFGSLAVQQMGLWSRLAWSYDQDGDSSDELGDVSSDALMSSP